MQQKKFCRAWHIILIINSILIFSCPLRSMELMYPEDANIYLLSNIPPEIINYIVRLFILVCHEDLKMVFNMSNNTYYDREKLINLLAVKNTQVYLWEGGLGRKIQELCGGQSKLQNFCAYNNYVLIATLDNQIFCWDTGENIITKFKENKLLTINEMHFGPQPNTAFALGYLGEDYEKEKKEQIFLWNLKNQKNFLGGELHGHGYKIDTALFIDAWGTLITDGIDNPDEHPTLWHISCESEELRDKKKSLIAYILCLHKFHKKENDFSRMRLKKSKRKTCCLKWFSGLFYK